MKLSSKLKSTQLAQTTFTKEREHLKTCKDERRGGGDEVKTTNHINVRSILKVFTYQINNKI
jgi:hypothetical protein